MTTRILTGDCRSILQTLPDNSIDCVVTSPPYFGLRDYGTDGQIGLEASPQAYVAEMVVIFREVRRVLKKTGTLWLNLGDSYSGSGKGAWDVPDERKKHIKETYRPNVDPTKIRAIRPGGDPHGGIDERGQRNRNGLGPVSGLKSKDLVGIPWRVAFALQDDGWYLRQDIIWHKLNPMPESVRDRCTKAHEYLFLLSKSARYHYDGAAIAEKSVYGGEELDILRSHKSRAEAMGRNPSGNELLAVQRRESKKRGDFNGKTEAMPGRNAFRAIRTMRNKRSVWSLVSRPFPGAHFATFPPKLVELCLKAGCPEKVCSECGNPIVRQKDGATYYDGSMVGSDPQRKYGNREYGRGPKNNLGVTISRTIGFRPSCHCNAGYIPGTVLDPFGGAGTTSLVADRMGLHSVMIELNPDYAEMARWRLIDEAGMFAEFLAAE